ncbi:MAG: biopolymer transport protein TolR [Myxococcota bacterium]|jgi:biopolymer transport protein TolR
MGMSGGSGPGGTMADINVTPMVDVMLVLLIIFMITAPLMQTGVDIDLPRADAPPLILDENADQLVLSIPGDNTFALNDVGGIPMEQMAVRLPALALANPDQAIFLQADGAVTWEELAPVFAACKNAGFPRVGLVFDPLGAPDPE